LRIPNEKCFTFSSDESIGITANNSNRLNLIVPYKQRFREGAIPRSRGSRVKYLEYKQRQKFGFKDDFTHTGLQFCGNRTEFAIYLRNVLFVRSSVW
jgi:hypothetical protein